MSQQTSALCGHCRKDVPSRHEARDGKIFLVKECPSCGCNEALISSDASMWNRKREIWGYKPEAHPGCGLKCGSCRTDHSPTVVLVEVTNRCNMNCPICIAGIQSVGFDYNPPREYFARIFETISRLNPKPFVEFYGGEPTVREDLFALVRMARKEYDLKVRVVTNGLRLADEAYCRELCALKVPLRISFDGCDPETYRRLRGDAGIVTAKLRALENLRKYSSRKHAILCCMGRGINDQHVADIFHVCHEYRDVIDQIGFIPLKEDWSLGAAGGEDQTTPEDIERAIRQRVVDGNVDFIPAGIARCLNRARLFFTRKHSKNFMFSGSHPNCESATFLVSDGQRYRSINRYLKIPLDRLAEEVFKRSAELDRRLLRRNPRKAWDRWVGRGLVVKAFAPIVLRAGNLRAVFHGNPLVGLAKVAWGVLRGRRVWDALRQVTGIPSFLRVAVLPFEEYLSIDAHRLANCGGAFAYEDVRDGAVKFIPVCTWFLSRKNIFQTICEKYGVVSTGDDPAPVATSAPASQAPTTVGSVGG